MRMPQWLIAGTAAAVLALIMSPAGPAQAQAAILVPPAPAAPQAELMRRAQIIKPSSDERKWQRIPWLTDLSVAQRLAQQEKRPLFLWVTGDDPLERC